MKQIALGDFFKNLTSDDNDDADKYKSLLKVVNEQLTGVKVFRFGDVEAEIYLVGKTKEGEWVGPENQGSGDLTGNFIRRLRRLHRLRKKMGCLSAIYFLS